MAEEHPRRRLTGLALLLVAATGSGGCASWPGAGSVEAQEAARPADGVPAPAAGEAPGAGSVLPPPPDPAPEGPVYHPAGQALIEQARRQSAAGDLEAAGSTLERGLRVDPENPWIWLELAGVRAAQGDGAGAEGMARRAASLSGRDPDAAAAARRFLGGAGP